MLLSERDQLLHHFFILAAQSFYRLCMKIFTLLHYIYFPSYIFINYSQYLFQLKYKYQIMVHYQQNGSKQAFFYSGYIYAIRHLTGVQKQNNQIFALLNDEETIYFKISYRPLLFQTKVNTELKILKHNINIKKQRTFNIFKNKQSKRKVVYPNNYKFHLQYQKIIYFFNQQNKNMEYNKGKQELQTNQKNDIQSGTIKNSDKKIGSFLDRQFANQKNDLHRRKNITDKQSNQLRRKVIQKQKDNIWSFKHCIPVIMINSGEGQEMIPQDKLDEIFEAAKQSLSESDSSNSGSYVMVKKSQFIRLKRQLFRERVIEGLNMEKVRKLKEDIFKQLEQCSNKQYSMDNLEGYNSHQIEENQKSTQPPRNENSLKDRDYQLQEQRPEIQIPQEVIAKTDGNIRMLGQQNPIQNQYNPGQLNQEIQQKGITKTIKKQKKQRYQEHLKQNQQRMQQDYLSESQSDEQGLYRVQDKGNFQVYKTENGYHQSTCEFAQKFGIAKTIPIHVDEKIGLGPCQICFP
ncbi:hypothetical protein pb186bvf_020078 [Paramecium bursaria]